VIIFVNVLHLTYCTILFILFFCIVKTGGFGYSIGAYNPWPWLVSQAAAEAMAVKVAQWPSLYKCDGIDLDIEAGAGDQASAGQNLVHFVRKLRQLVPNIYIGQPTYGYPQVDHPINFVLSDFVISEF
jgi:hypothetical protein